MGEYISVITSKGQVTVPKAVRNALGLEEKDQLLFVVDGERAILIPLRRRPLDQLFGALPATRPFPGSDAVRDELHASLGERLAGQGDA